jgi:hypothetical protein
MKNIIMCLPQLLILLLNFTKIDRAYNEQFRFYRVILARASWKSIILQESVVLIQFKFHGTNACLLFPQTPVKIPKLTTSL